MVILVCVMLICFLLINDMDFQNNIEKEQEFVFDDLLLKIKESEDNILNIQSKINTLKKEKVMRINNMYKEIYDC